MTFAIIENDKVANIIDAPDGYDGIRVDHLETVPGIGWHYDGETFTPPTEPTEPGPRMVTVYALRSRFTPEEKRAIYAAAAVNIDIRIWLDDLASVQNNLVDLNLQATIESVTALEAATLIGAGRAAQILA